VGLAALGCHNHAGTRLEAGVDLGPAGSVPEPDALPPEATADALLPDAKVESTIVGRCAVDDDCLPVLDYRAGFICDAPVPASKEDVAADPCLVPGGPNAACSTPPPPSTCVGGVGRIPVTHSCVVSSCLVPVCREGKCALSWEASRPCPYPKDCASLRTVYLNTLALVQRCYPSSPACGGDLKDTCGCPTAYDVSGGCATAAVTAFKAWQDAGCPLDSCETCPAATGPYPTCVPDAVGTRGTCRL
jgi:hypothetical protein